MELNFPELTTMGALFRFAATLESVGLTTLEKAASTATDDEVKSKLERIVTKRRRRVEELERARKEKLNETVLEPLMDMSGTPFVPDIPSSIDDLDHVAAVKLARDVEEKTVAFYGEAVEKAGPVLAEVKRIFARFQKESDKNLKAL